MALRKNQNVTTYLNNSTSFFLYIYHVPVFYFSFIFEFNNVHCLKRKHILGKIQLEIWNDQFSTFDLGRKNKLKMKSRKMKIFPAENDDASTKSNSMNARISNTYICISIREQMHNERRKVGSIYLTRICFGIAMDPEGVIFLRIIRTLSHRKIFNSFPKAESLLMGIGMLART